MRVATYYAVQHLPTGGYLPAILAWHGRGGSFVKPTAPDDGQPRLFLTKRAAKNYLTSWLSGETHSSGGEDCDIWLVKKPERRREDMEVVPIEVRFR